MNTSRNFLQTCRTSSIGLLLSLVVFVPAYATSTADLYDGIDDRTDDTEIYYGLSTPGNNPNITIVIDTSGSMVWPIFARKDYDPTEVYEGDCAADRYYYELPRYTYHELPQFNLYPDGVDSCDPIHSVHESVLQCQAGRDILETKGYYRDRFAMWHPISSDWVNPPVGPQVRTTNNRYYYYHTATDPSHQSTNPFWNEAIYPTAILECENDYGIHGQDGDTINLYPAPLGAGVPFASTEPVDFWGAGGVLDPLPGATDADGNPLNYPLGGGGVMKYVFFDGNFLNWVRQTEQEGSPAVRRKIEVVKDVAEGFLNSITGYNVSLVQYAGYPVEVNHPDGRDPQGATILVASDDIEEPGHRDLLISKIREMGAYSHTPISEAMYETFLYLSGGLVDYGVSPNARRTIFVEDDINEDNYNEYRPIIDYPVATNTPDAIDSTSTDGLRYLSPIQASCQETSVVMLTDGQPNRDDHADGKITALLGENPDLPDQTCGSVWAGGGDNCYDELAKYMFEFDAMPDEPGLQNIATYNIGLDIEQMHESERNLLRELLTEASTGTIVQVVLDADGNPVINPATGEPLTETVPGYIEAESADDLLLAFQSIFESEAADAGSTTTPSLTLNNFNRFEHRDDLILSLYKPGEANRPRWDGNVKRYRLDYVDNKLKILGQGGEVAVDENGNFIDNVQSFWSTEVDGSDILKGGIASAIKLVGPFTRKVYTHISADPYTCSIDGCPIPDIEAGNVDITTSYNEIELSKASNLYDTFWDGLITAAERENVVNWINGIDPDSIVAPDDPFIALGEGNRHGMGDPLHSSPLMISFTGGTPDEPNIMLYSTTNDGYFHAIRINQPLTATLPGEALLHYSYIPRDLMPRTAKLYSNALGYTAPGLSRDFGLDGQLSYLIHSDDPSNPDDDGVVDSGEEAWVFMGMGRGGRNYYGFEVDDSENLTQKWLLRGGTGDFAELGFTWSKPTPARIKYGAGEKEVLLFAGGMDPNKDTRNLAAERSGGDEAGRAIYMVDADTGDLLWAGISNFSSDLPPASLHQTFSDMDYSIPSDLRTIDMNRDGLVDRIYVGDTGGQLWRFDIANETGSSDMLDRVSGGVIARIGGSGELNRRMIFHPPSVAKVNNDFGNFLAVSFATGHQAHPLENDVQDAFYMVRDPYVFTVPGGSVTTADYGIPASLLNLADITDLLTPTMDEIQANIFAEGIKGWYIKFNQSLGEKSLSSPLALGGSLFFTTYLPDEPPVSCSATPSLGNSRYYQINLITGVSNLMDEEGNLIEDRYVNLGLEGLPPPPVPIFSERPPIVCDSGDTECLDAQRECPNETSHISLLVGTQIKDPGICNAPIRTYWFEENTDGPDIAGESDST